MLEELDRTWHMLDELDSPATNEDFTCTTLEMVAVAAAEDAQQAKAQRPRRRLRAALRAVVGLVGAAAVGFLAVAWALPDPNAQLLQDLPLLENYDQYRDIVSQHPKSDSIDFLRACRRKNCFPRRPKMDAKDLRWNSARGFRRKALGLLALAVVLAVGLAAFGTLSQRRRQLEEMSAEQREDVLRAEQQFHALSPQDQQRIRELHEQIENSPDRAELAQRWTVTASGSRRSRVFAA